MYPVHDCHCSHGSHDAGTGIEYTAIVNGAGGTTHCQCPHTRHPRRFPSTTAEQKDKVDADIWLTLARGKSQGKTAEMLEQASQTSRGQRNGFLAGFKAVTRRTQTR